MDADDSSHSTPEPQAESAPVIEVLVNEKGSGDGHLLRA